LAKKELPKVKSAFSFERPWKVPDQRPNLLLRGFILNNLTLELLKRARLNTTSHERYEPGAKLRLFEPLHAALWAFRKIMYLFLISIAKRRNIAKWYSCK